MTSALAKLLLLNFHPTPRPRPRLPVYLQHLESGLTEIRLLIDHIQPREHGLAGPREDPLDVEGLAGREAVAAVVGGAGDGNAEGFFGEDVGAAAGGDEGGEGRWGGRGRSSVGVIVGVVDGVELQMGEV